jgi:hypothetical protein
MPEPRNTNPNIAFEASDMSVRAVGGIGLGVACFLVFIALVLAWGYAPATHDVYKAPTMLPPAPALQSDPHADLMAFETEKQARLTSYGWVDRAKGIIHIPIDEAMRQVAARGIPDWPAGTATGSKP